MANRADMIINPQSGLLEFASGGKSVLRIRVAQTVIDAVMYEIRAFPSNRQRVINHTFLYYKSLKDNSNGE